LGASRAAEDVLYASIIKLAYTSNCKLLIFNMQRQMDKRLSRCQKPAVALEVVRAVPRLYPGFRPSTDPESRFSEFFTPHVDFWLDLGMMV
jgi:hypothetical protein